MAHVFVKGRLFNLVARLGTLVKTDAMICFRVVIQPVLTGTRRSLSCCQCNGAIRDPVDSSYLTRAAQPSACYHVTVSGGLSGRMVKKMLKVMGAVFSWSIFCVCCSSNGGNSAAPIYADVSTGSLRMKQVASGNDFSCGLKIDNTVVCWGINDAGQSSPPSDTFSKIAAGQDHSCGLRTDGTVVCWGASYAGQLLSPSGVFSDVTAGAQFACGLQTDGNTACWGVGNDGQTSPPSSSFQQISAGFAHVCGIRPDNTVECWGNNLYLQGTPPAGAFSLVSAGGFRTCGLQLDGAVACWGDNQGADPALEPSGSLLQVSTGGDHTCYLDTDGIVSCWGIGCYGSQATGRLVLSCTPGTDKFSQISAGQTHTCGLRPDGSVTCWAANPSPNKECVPP